MHTKMEVKVVDILTKLNPKLYQKYVTTEKGRPVLYVVIKKFIYGTLQAGPLF